MLLQGMRRQIGISLLILFFLVSGTLIAIFYGMGYRFSLNGNSPLIAGTGLLVATSSPDGAKVLINGHLTTATDNTINLAPGDYDIKIFKDGYFPWEKKITIKKEVVSKADALLFPNAPKLESITNVGISNPVRDPSETKIAYTVASQSAQTNGIYIFDMTVRPILTLQNTSTQIENDVSDSFSEASLQWAPDSSHLLASVSSKVSSTIYLLQSGGFNQSPQDVTETIASVNASWDKLKTDKTKSLMDSLPSKLRGLVADDFNILEWSSDETKILYAASQSASIPLIINPRLIGTDSTEETRDIKKGVVYVYDIKEDRNYQILDALPAKNEANQPLSIMWYPDSKHLVYVHDGKIDMMEHDGQNQTTVYAGPFEDHYVFPWPDATKVVILTNLGNPTIAPNLYTIGLQ
jgi:hypothetical protein